MVNNILITGYTGFLGSRLRYELSKKLYRVDCLEEDIRSITTTKRYDYIYHFGSPSSQVLFSRNPQYCINTTIQGFNNVLNLARQTGAKLIYPSTGLLNTSQTLNDYSMSKLLCEQMAKNSGVETLGLRIFATYGPGEEHKRDYKSVIGLFLEDIYYDKTPVIYGDGTQTRDFVYIDDVINSIIYYAESRTGIEQIGSGISTSFNQIINIISKLMYGEEDYIKPIYVDKPINYAEATVCTSPIDTLSLEEGIKAYYEEVYSHHDNT